MIGMLFSILSTIGDLVKEHPDLAAKLVDDTMNVLHPVHDNKSPSIDQLTAVMSGLAAARANAVQEAQRRAKTPTVSK